MKKRVISYLTPDLRLQTGSCVINKWWIRESAKRALKVITEIWKSILNGQAASGGRPLWAVWLFIQTCKKAHYFWTIWRWNRDLWEIQHRMEMEKRAENRSREINGKECVFSHILTDLDKRLILHICAHLPIFDILISKLRLFGYRGERKSPVDGSASTANGR